MTEHNRPRILWIGRMIFGEGFRVREVELAKRLTDRYDIFALDHTTIMRGQRPKIADKLRMRMDLFRSAFNVIEVGPITRFTMPVVASTGPLFSRAAADWNHLYIERALKQFECDQVFLSSPFFFLPPRHRSYRVHFDVVDNFHDEWANTYTGRARKRFHRDCMKAADTISASSLQLCDYVRRLTGREPVYVPNGAPRDEFCAEPSTEAQAIRKNLGIDDRFVLGTIGNHTMPFTGLERLVRATIKARKQRPELALMVVGPNGEKALKYSRGESDGIYVTGAVSPDIVSQHFHACDAGVHAHDLRAVTHDAMALNVIEFCAANKAVLSSPFRELQRLDLPNVRFTKGESVDEWAEALNRRDNFASFDGAELQRRMAPFNWEHSAATLRETLTKPRRPREPEIIHFQRKPLPDYHSIEALFIAIRKEMGGAAVTLEECPHTSRGLLRRWLNLRWARRRAGVINHITGDVHYLALGLPGAQTLLTVHDCVAMHRGSAFKRAVVRKLYFEWPAKRAKIITVISEATRRELIEISGCEPDKVHVVPDCVGDVFQHARAEFNSDNPTVLLIGTLAHKNLERVIEATAGIPCRLHIVGRLTSQQQHLLADREFKNSFDLTPTEMAAAYRDSDIVCFASTYEGFGMPILEAQATGRVVITSDLEPMSEVAGDGAHLVEPEDVASISSGFERVINDADYREKLIAAGRENIEIYRPRRIAQMCLELYERLR